MPLQQIPKNESSVDGMVGILEDIHKYVPVCCCQTPSENVYSPVPFGGDQMTVARVRSAQGIRITSGPEHALRNLIPFAGDWHCKVNYMEVSITIVTNECVTMYFFTGIC